jgi:hypothetical protein
MLQQFYDYFREIEMASAIQERADQLCNEFARLIPAPIERVFVNDLYDPQGIRRYLNLELVGGGILMEFKNFVVADNIDFLDLNGGVKWIEMHKGELKEVYGETSTKSWIKADVIFEGSPLGQQRSQTGLALTAVHNNCPHLADFVKLELLTRISGSNLRRAQGGAAG